MILGQRHQIVAKLSDLCSGVLGLRALLCGKQWPQEPPQRLQAVKISQKIALRTCQTPLSIKARESARKIAMETIPPRLNEFVI